MSKSNRYKIIFLLFASGVLGFVFSWYQHKTPLAETTDIPVIETYHFPAMFVSQLAGDKHAGEKIFKEFCAVCHAKNPSIDINAPRIGDKKAWQLRHKLGMETLLKMTITGVGAMPARGGCFECSDEQLREAIKYILLKN